MERQTGIEPACYSFAESCLTVQRHWRENITSVYGVSKDLDGNSLYRIQYQYSKLREARKLHMAAVLRNMY